MTRGASFRDPGGRVVIRDGRVFREVASPGLACLDAALNSPAVRAEIERGRFVRTEVLARDASSATLEHEAIPFPSFPYEWPPEMLYEAGALSIELALALAEEGRGLKDATPFNVLYRGATPVFVDLLSVEQRDPRDPLWLARAQFIRTFILPLAAESDFGIPLAQSLMQRDGLEPEAFYRLLPPTARVRPKYLPLVSMPVWLGARKNPDDASIYRPQKIDDKEKAAYIFRRGLLALRKALDRFAPKSRRASRWSDYMSADCSYTPEQFKEKEAFVAEALREVLIGATPGRVLDVGANTGHFSRMAARAGASVVAIDGDTAVAGEIWRQAAAEKLDILPLVVNLAQPTPPTGWRNLECPSFLDRACAAGGGFDLVLMLAVVHHMLATERIPLPEIVDLAADLTSRFAVIEFVDCDDRMFRRLSRGRDELYAHLHADLFEQCVAARFDIVRKREITGSKRTLYVLRKK
jgi:SAM-dependent methyltransferase